MPAVHAHLFQFSFDVFVEGIGPTATVKRREALRWLSDRLPSELLSLHYEPVRGRIRVEMLVRVGWSVEQLQRYAVAVEALCLAHVARIDEGHHRADLEAGRASLQDELGEAALPEPH